MVGGRKADNDLEAWPASAAKPTQHDRCKTLSTKNKQKLKINKNKTKTNKKE